MNSWEQISPKADQPEHSQSSEKLVTAADKVIDFICKSFSVEDNDNLERIKQLRDSDPEARFIIASSHFSNLDGPAAIKVFGPDLNLQITVDSTLFGLTPQEILFRLGGKENFTGVDYKKRKNAKTAGSFNPDNFDVLAEKIQQGKTPWMALHTFTTKGELQDARVGSAYLAQKTGAYIIPAALEVHGPSISLEGPAEITKAVIGKVEATYHVAEPIKLEPIDVSIIEEVLRKRTAGEKVSLEERVKFSEIHEALRTQADSVAQIIAGMLPAEQKGQYA